MGIFKKYKDKNGKATGPCFIQYPYERDAATGQVKYKTIKGSWKKKKAQDILHKKQDEFFEKDQLGITVNLELTFNQLMDWGLKQEVMKAKASASDDLSRAEHLKKSFGKMKAFQVTPLIVENFRVKMKGTSSDRTNKPFSGTTINKMISLARRIYYLGMDAGKVSRNPFARRGTFKEEPKGRYIPDDEFWKIHEFLPDYLKPVVLTAYMTGMRRGEILGLTWDRVDLFSGYIDLSSDVTKTDELRRIYFNTMSELKKVFIEAERKRKSGQKFVFLKPDGSLISKWYIRNLLIKACNKAKVGPYRLHDLRHSFNTNMQKAGVNQTVIMKLTGHKTNAMFVRYSHLDKEQGEDAMEKLNRLLSGKKDEDEFEPGHQKEKSR